MCPSDTDSFVDQIKQECSLFTDRSPEPRPTKETLAQLVWHWHLSHGSACLRTWPFSLTINMFSCYQQNRFTNSNCMLTQKKCVNIVISFHAKTIIRCKDSRRAKRTSVGCFPQNSFFVIQMARHKHLKPWFGLTRNNDFCYTTSNNMKIQSCVAWSKRFPSCNGYRSLRWPKFKIMRKLTQTSMSFI